MIINIWFVGSTVTLQSEWYTWLQVVHRSMMRSIIICKFPSSWWQILRKLVRFTSRMEFLRIEISYDCGVFKGYRTRNTMSEESFSSIKPHSKLVENMLVWVERPNSFQYGTWSFPWSRQCHWSQIIFSICKNSFSQSLQFPGKRKRKIKLNQGKFWPDA